MKYSPMLESLFALCEEFEASDVHLAVGIPPRFRIRGQVVEKGDFAPLDMKAVDALAMELGVYTLPVGCPDGTEKVRRILIESGSIDGAISSETGSRYRFNIFRDNGRHAVAIRKLNSKFWDFSELGVPERVRDFCDEHDGMFIVTGSTGSGKSTTLATMVNHINSYRCGHIITIEDPIEFIHESKRCVVNQRQVGRDALSFNDALVESLRQDPDVILVGELRDIESMRTALRASETGHLVLATMHAGDCTGAIERIIGIFPPEEQETVAIQLSSVLRGIIAQNLILGTDGERHPACELLVNTPAIRHLISSGKYLQIYGAMETGLNAGMRTMDQSLTELYAFGLISEQTALAMSHNTDAMKVRLESMNNLLSPVQ